jgi:hypothetical protein
MGMIYYLGLEVIDLLMCLSREREKEYEDEVHLVLLADDTWAIDRSWKEGVDKDKL